MNKIIQFGLIMMLLSASIGVLHYVDDVRYAQIRAGNQEYRLAGGPVSAGSQGSSSSESSESSASRSSSGSAQTASSSSVPTSGSCVVKVEAPSVVRPDEVFDVSVIAENIPSESDEGEGLYGWEFVLRWTPDAICCVSEAVNWGLWPACLGPWVGSPIDNAHGTYHQCLTARNPSESIAGTFWLANLTFRTVDHPARFETGLNLTNAAGLTYVLLTKLGSDIPHYYVSGHVRINGLSSNSTSRNPQEPGYDEEVEVSVDTSGIVINETAQVSQAFLSYEVDSVCRNVSMNRHDTKFKATIPAHPYGKTVQYEISAGDANGNWGKSNTFSYTVIDAKAPEIASANLEPACPYPYVPSNITRASEPTLIKAAIGEPANASGMAVALLSYRTEGSGWWNTTMTYTLTSGFWTVVIPGQAGNTTVEFRIAAYDKAGNEAVYTGFFTVRSLSTGDINGDGFVDATDTEILSEHLGEISP